MPRRSPKLSYTSPLPAPHGRLARPSRSMAGSRSPTTRRPDGGGRRSACDVTDLDEQIPDVELGFWAPVGRAVRGGSWPSKPSRRPTGSRSPRVSADQQTPRRWSATWWSRLPRFMSCTQRGASPFQSSCAERESGKSASHSYTPELLERVGASDADLDAAWDLFGLAAGRAAEAIEAGREAEQLVDDAVSVWRDSHDAHLALTAGWETRRASSGRGAARRPLAGTAGGWNRALCSGTDSESLVTEPRTPHTDRPRGHAWPSRRAHAARGNRTGGTSRQGHNRAFAVRVRRPDCEWWQARPHDCSASFRVERGGRVSLLRALLRASAARADQAFGLSRSRDRAAAHTGSIVQLDRLSRSFARSR